MDEKVITLRIYKDREGDEPGLVDLHFSERTSAFGAHYVSKNVEGPVYEIFVK